MSRNPSNTTRKTSSDSGQSSALDRWSQRRLQRLNTEQGFREQRQGGQGVLSPPLSQDSSYSNASSGQYAQETQPQQHQHQHVQPHHPSASAYQAQRSGPTSGQPNAAQSQSVSSTSRANNYAQHDAPLPQTYSPPDSASQYHQDLPRPPLTQSRSFNSQPEDPLAASTAAPAPAAKSSRSGMSNRQSVHNGLNAREGSGLTSQGSGGGGHPGVPAFNANVVPTPESQAQQGYGNTSQQKPGDNGRGTPQPNKPMTKEDIEQLIQDHAQLRTFPSLYPFTPRWC